MPATIKDVAIKANTSVATVSRFINNSGNVSNQLKNAIQEAIRELDYSPQRVHSQRSIKSVGLIFPDLDNLYYIPVIKGLEQELSLKNYNLLLCSSQESIEVEKKHISNLLLKGVDGIVLLGTRPISESNKHIIELSEKIPTLIINDQILGSNVHSLMVEEAEGAYKAIDYLIGLGHSKIAFLNGDLNYSTYRYKQTGYEKALHDNGLTINPEYLVLQEPHEIGGYEGAINLFSLKNPPTAIFSANDQMAIGVMKASYEHNIKIPEDLSLIGFSNTPISTAVYPELTTVNQFPYKTGQEAAGIIYKLIKHQSLHQTSQILRTELIIRDSCSSI